jgi:hypothetical protein
MMLAFLWVGMGVAMFQSNLILYLRFVVEAESEFENMMLVLLGTTFLSMQVHDFEQLGFRP